MNRRFLQALSWMAALLCVLLVSPFAHAGGRWRLRSHDVKEVSGAWHLFVSIDLTRAPSIAHVPMKFMFTKTMVYERALTDASKQPVLNKIAVQNQMPSIESLDVDFADGTGKIYKSTRFDFGLTRQRGFEAGEYTMKVQLADGTNLAGTANLVLEGDNPVVDRRSITFDANNKKIKKVDNGLDGGVASNSPNNDTAMAAPTSTEVQPVGTAAPFIPASAFQETDAEQVKEKPGGCGCSVPGVPLGTVELFGAPLGLALLGLRRRRRRDRDDAR